MSVVLLAASVCMAVAEPLYLRGNFNDWGTDCEFTELGDGRYVLELGDELTPGDEHVWFKICNSDYSVEYGVAVQNSVDAEMGQSYTLVSKAGNGGTVYELNVREALNDVVLCFDISTLTLAVSPRLYLVGSFNNWGCYDKCRLATVDGRHYTLSDVSFSAGDEFQIAHSGWGAYEFGYGYDKNRPTAVKWGRSYTLVGDDGSGNFLVQENIDDLALTFDLATKAMSVAKTGDGNMKLAQQGANRRFVFRLSTRVLTISDQTTGLEYAVPDDAGLPPMYYNLQGMRVEHPSGGVYIVRRGDVVRKEFIQ